VGRLATGPWAAVPGGPPRALFSTRGSAGKNMRTKPKAAEPTEEVYGDVEEPTHDGVPPPHWCANPPGYNETVGELMPLITRFARLAHAEGDESCLAAARVLDGLFRCLDKPREFRVEIAPKMSVAGNALLRSAKATRRFPGNISRLSQAEEEIARVVENGIRDKADDARLARYVEAARMCGEHFGTHKVLPHAGSETERVICFEAAIRKLRENTPGELQLDPEAVVIACAHACKNRGKLFEGKRKREKYQAEHG
jgi:hypothetical protein